MVAALDEAEETLAGRAIPVVKLTSLGVGVAAIFATGGLALVALPAGGAAIVPGLAAFGPGGMIGGLLTAGALVTVGSGGIAVSLASPSASSADVESFVLAQLAEAILRDAQGYEQPPWIWDGFVEMELELRRQITRFETISDKSAASLKVLRQKLETVGKAIRHLESKGLQPGEVEVLEIMGARW